MKELYPYIKDGIRIDGDPEKGYTVFTVKTQHFKVSSLDELTPVRFEEAIKEFKDRQKIEENWVRTMNTARKLNLIQ